MPRSWVRRHRCHLTSETDSEHSLQACENHIPYQVLESKCSHLAELIYNPSTLEGSGLPITSSRPTWATE